RALSAGTEEPRRGGSSVRGILWEDTEKLAGCSRRPAARRRPKLAGEAYWFSSLLAPRAHAGAKPADSIDLDADDQALLAGLAIGVLVHSEKSLRQLVDVRVGSRIRDRCRPVDHQVRLWLRAILDRDSDSRVSSQILRLLATVGRVEHRLIAIDVHPHHRHLRLSLLVQRDDVAVGLVLQQLLNRVRQRDRHRDLLTTGPESYAIS